MLFQILRDQWIRQWWISVFYSPLGKHAACKPHHLKMNGNRWLDLSQVNKGSLSPLLLSAHVHALRHKQYFSSYRQDDTWCCILQMCITCIKIAWSVWVMTRSHPLGWLQYDADEAGDWHLFWSITNSATRKCICLLSFSGIDNASLECQETFIEWYPKVGSISNNRLYFSHPHFWPIPPPCTDLQTVEKKNGPP